MLKSEIENALLKEQEKSKELQSKLDGAQSKIAKYERSQLFMSNIIDKIFENKLIQKKIIDLIANNLTVCKDYDVYSGEYGDAEIFLGEHHIGIEIREHGL